MTKPTHNPARKSGPTGQVDQMEFDGLFHFSHLRQNLTIQEVATAMGISDEKIRHYLDSGLLVNSAVNEDAILNPSAKATRDHVRIARYSACALYIELQMARTGEEPPYYQSAATLWWRKKLRELKNPTLQQKSEV